MQGIQTREKADYALTKCIASGKCKTYGGKADRKIAKQLLADDRYPPAQ